MKRFHCDGPDHDDTGQMVCPVTTDDVTDEDCRNCPNSEASYDLWVDNQVEKRWERGQWGE